METTNKSVITVKTVVHAPVEKVWQYWTDPAHITKWCYASDTWHAPYADNDLRKDGKFKITMAAKDNSMSFDFEGIYTAVENHKRITYILADGRKVDIKFSVEGDTTTIVETFDPESTNSIEMQRDGWQAILNNFRKHTEESD